MGNRRGRPRKAGAREPNGQLQRSTLAQIIAADREQTERERQNATAVVMAQPHRRGNDHPWCATALGRFCLAHRLKKDLHDAGEKFADLVRRWRAAWGVPVPISLGIGGSGQGPLMRTAAGWEEQIASVENALRRVSTAHLIAIRHLVLDDADVPAQHSSVAIEALMVLARSMDIDPGKHPFA